MFGETNIQYMKFHLLKSAGCSSTLGIMSVAWEPLGPLAPNIIGV